MEDALNHVVYSKNVIEFVTVANEFCSIIEGSEQYNREDFVIVATRILPLLYLKASVLPKVEAELDEPIEKYVDELSYSNIQEGIKFKLGRFNDYLEVFNSEMQYSDTPIIAFIAEDITDIYQDLKDFVLAYKLGVTEIMNDALAEVFASFQLFWGQRLVNTLRALHNLLYSEENLEEEEGEDKEPEKRDTKDWIISRMQRDYNEGSDSELLP